MSILSQKWGFLAGLAVMLGFHLVTLPKVTPPPDPVPEERPDPEPPPAIPAPLGVQLLRTPFVLAEIKAPNWFNHAPDVDQGYSELVYTGVWQRGKPKHAGYDFLMPVGTPILAAADGTVTVVFDAEEKCPNMDPPVRHSMYVKVLHPTAMGDYATLYLHLSRIDVVRGQEVIAGSQLGLSGQTGCATGPHLHFGVSVVTNRKTGAGYAVDPYGWTGDGEDPSANPNTLLWLDGQAPHLSRSDVEVE